MGVHGTALPTSQSKVRETDTGVRGGGAPPRCRCCVGMQSGVGLLGMVLRDGGAFKSRPTDVWRCGENMPAPRFGGDSLPPGAAFVP